MCGSGERPQVLLSPSLPTSVLLIPVPKMLPCSGIKPVALVCGQRATESTISPESRLFSLNFIFHRWWMVGNLCYCVNLVAPVTINPGQFFWANTKCSHWKDPVRVFFGGKPWLGRRATQSRWDAGTWTPLGWCYRSLPLLTSTEEGNASGGRSIALVWAGPHVFYHTAGLMVRPRWDKKLQLSKLYNILLVAMAF